VSKTVGIVFVIDGVGGFGLVPRVFERILPECGVRHEVRHFYWSHGFGRWHKDLTDDEHLRTKGGELADEIMGWQTHHPSDPVYIVAKSGGTAVALHALGELPDKSIQRAILLAPAVSPDFDLEPALRAVHRELVSFWSPHDKWILGFGTTIFGTADGVSGEGAGKVGFQVPERQRRARPELYGKLRQVPWEPSMRKTGNLGTHLGTSMPDFVRVYVAPLLTDPPEAEPRRDSVDSRAD
jgi:pimeloyl-ACP methyl ester carboxylesterase